MVTGDTIDRQNKSTAIESPLDGEELCCKMSWAMRLKRVFNIDITVCRHCQGPVRIIACIEDRQVINKILAHINQQQEPLVIKSVRCLASIKTQIINELDAVTVIDDKTLSSWSSDDCNTKLKSMVFSTITAFIEQINISDILVSPPPPLSASLFFGIGALINTSMSYGVVTLMALITSMRTQRTDLRLASSLVLATSLIGLSRRCQGMGFFSRKADNLEYTQPDEPLSA